MNELVWAKAKIRNILGLENYFMQMSDNKQKTEEMVKVLYNLESVKSLNCAEPY